MMYPVVPNSDQKNSEVPQSDALSHLTELGPQFPPTSSACTKLG